MRRENRDGNDKGKVKFRVVEFELEGTNASLQESLRGIAAALNRSNSVQTRAPHVLPAAPEKSIHAEDAAVEQQGDLFDRVEPTSELEDGGENATPQKRNYPKPNFMDELDTKSPMPLKEFCEAHNTGKLNRKYLVIARWLKEHRGITDITIHHVFTCFRTLGWNTPEDVTQPMRSMKKQAWFAAGQSAGTYRLTNAGYDEADKHRHGTSVK